MRPCSLGRKRLVLLKQGRMGKEERGRLEEGGPQAPHVGLQEAGTERDVGPGRDSCFESSSDKQNRES